MHECDSTRTRAKVERRTAWNGLDDAERQRPGAPLLRMLLHEANSRGVQLQEMAALLGCTYGYIAHLRNGIRDIPAVSDEFIGKCAVFLGVPRITVMVAAGKLSLSDFHVPDEVSMERAINTGLEFMQRDYVWGGAVPADVFTLSQETQLLIVRLYETATGARLLPKTDMSKLFD